VVSLPGLLKDIKSLEQRNRDEGPNLFCDIEIAPGDFGGKHILVSLAPHAAVHMARQLLELAATSVEGKHFHIDKCSIALDTDHQLVFSRAKAEQD
jgi:hypothetical protein